MSRRRNSLILDLIAVATKFPWWLSLLLAAGSYIGLGMVSQPDQAAPGSLDNLGASVLGQFAYTFSQIGRIVLPVVFVIAAVTNVARTIRTGKLANDYAQGKDPASFTWPEFEQLVEAVFRRRGFSVSTTRSGADGGVDLIAKRDGQKLLVQCKHWNAQRVGVTVVRELKGVVAASDAQGGVIVSSGRFTNEVVSFSRRAGIELIDGKALHRMASDGSSQNNAASRASEEQNPDAAIPTTPQCRSCGAEMILRTARRGTKAGQQFWGCSQYPRCRTTHSA